MNNKEIFDKLAACRFIARNLEPIGFYQGFKLAVFINNYELERNRNPEQLKDLLISRVQNAKETACYEFDRIEKRIRGVFDGEK